MSSLFGPFIHYEICTLPYNLKQGNGQKERWKISPSATDSISQFLWLKSNIHVCLFGNANQKISQETSFRQYDQFPQITA